MIRKLLIAGLMMAASAAWGQYVPPSGAAVIF